MTYRTDRTDRKDRTDRTERTDRTDRRDRTDRTDSKDKRQDRQDRPQRQDRQDRQHRQDRQDRQYRQDRQTQSGYVGSLHTILVLHDVCRREPWTRPIPTHWDLLLNVQRPASVAEVLMMIYRTKKKTNQWGFTRWNTCHQITGIEADFEDEEIGDDLLPEWGVYKRSTFEFWKTFFIINTHLWYICLEFLAVRVIRIHIFDILDGRACCVLCLKKVWTRSILVQNYGREQSLRFPRFLCLVDFRSKRKKTLPLKV